MRTRTAKLASALAMAALALTATACSQPVPPAHFGACPVGQHWRDPSGRPTGWECVR